MNDLAGGPRQLHLWNTTEKQKQENWEEEENIWQQFLEKYADCKQEEILEITLNIIDQLTNHFLINLIPDDRSKHIAEGIRRQKFLDKNNEDKFFQDEGRDEKFTKKMKEYILKFPEIKDGLKKLFQNDKNQVNNFLDDILLINYNPKLKSFLFKVIKNNVLDTAKK